MNPSRFDSLRIKLAFGVALFIFIVIQCCVVPGAAADDPMFAVQSWKLNGLATPRFRIQGTESRNNPLRRHLTTPFSGDELFVRFRVRYQAKSIDTPEQNNGEFFVLWLDADEGNDASTHSNGVPNIGLHVADDGNRFMVRYASGGERFGSRLEGDRDFLVVGRLWKSKSGDDKPFDQCDLWVDPQADAEFAPHASVTRQKSISVVHWIGFSTGAKTEIEDLIEVWDIDVATTWRQILGFPPKLKSEVVEPGPAPQKTVAFRDDVLPILKAKCFDCHSGDDAEEGVRLDVFDEVMNRTAPRDAASSHLFRLVSKGEMPPDGEPLSEAEKSVLQAWIDEGLDWDEELLPTPIPQTDHWAFQFIKRPEVPKVMNQDWQFGDRLHPFRDGGRIGLTGAQGAGDVFRHRLVGIERVGFEGHRDPAAVGRQGGDVPSVDQHLSRVGGFQSGNQA